MCRQSDAKGLDIRIHSVSRKGRRGVEESLDFRWNVSVPPFPRFCQRIGATLKPFRRKRKKFHLPIARRADFVARGQNRFAELIFATPDIFTAATSDLAIGQYTLWCSVSALRLMNTTNFESLWRISHNAGNELGQLQICQSLWRNIPCVSAAGKPMTFASLRQYWYLAFSILNSFGELAQRWNYFAKAQNSAVRIARRSDSVAWWLSEIFR